MYVQFNYAFLIFKVIQFRNYLLYIFYLFFHTKLLADVLLTSKTRLYDCIIIIIIIHVTKWIILL